MSHLPDDRDLFNLTRSCGAFAAALIPEDSAIWKDRFLSRYDHPCVTDSTQFAFAYQLRRSVLRQFTEFADPKDPRLIVQLEVIRDMVIGAFSMSCILAVFITLTYSSLRGVQATTAPSSSAIDF